MRLTDVLAPLPQAPATRGADALPVLEFDRVALDSAVLSFAAYPGELVHITGGSPAGRQQALAIAAGSRFREPGRCRVAGLDTQALGPDERRALQRRCIVRPALREGLSTGLPLLASMALPALRMGVPASHALHRAERELDAIGLGSYAAMPPHALSTEQQRLAAIAAALACRPRLLVLDEPDDGLGAAEVTAVRLSLWALTSGHGSCVVMTTHHPRLIASADRHVHLGEHPESRRAA